MKLYYFSGACSLASNIALREAGLKFELVKVDRRTRKAADGLDFNEVNPKGYVPTLTLDSGEVLTISPELRRTRQAPSRSRDSTMPPSRLFSPINCATKEFCGRS